MQKFFRKHMNKILTVSMALLLVVWLGGSALQEMLTPKYGAELIATSVDGDIRQRDLANMQGVTTILTRLRFPWQSPLQIAGIEPLSVYDWVLLSREARRLGFVPSVTDAEDGLIRSGMSRLQVNSLANSLEIAPKQVYAAVAEYQNVMAAAQVVAEAGQISEAELRVAARDAREKITVNLVALKADSFSKTEGTFTDEQIQAFFEKYREQEAGVGMTFGYFQKPQVKVEFIKVDVAKVEQVLKLSPKSLERKARSYWKENRQIDRAFLKPRTPPKQVQLPATLPTTPAAEKTEDKEPSDESPGQGSFTLAQGVAQAGSDQQADAAEQPTQASPSDASQGATTDQSKTTEPPGATGKKTPPPIAAPPPPPAKPASPFFETWSEAREAAIGVIRKQEAAKRADKLVGYLIQRALEPWFDMDLGEDNYKSRPAGVDGPDYLAGLAGDLPPEFRWPGAVTTGVTDWFSEKDATRVPELGPTWVAIPGGSNIPFGTMSFFVQGLAELNDEADVDRSLFSALYQPGSLALRDGAGNLFLYRIIATKPAQPPASVDMVRDQLLKDMAKQRGFDEAKRIAEALKDAALKNGLEAAVEADAALSQIEGEKMTVQKPGPFVRKRPTRPGVFDKTYLPLVGFVDETFTRACFELGSADEGKVPVAVIEAPDLSLVTVVEFSNLEPLNLDTYASSRAGVKFRIQQERATRVFGEWLNPDLIKSRNRYEEARDEG